MPAVVFVVACCEAAGIILAKSLLQEAGCRRHLPIGRGCERKIAAEATGSSARRRAASRVAALTAQGFGMAGRAQWQFAKANVRNP